MNTLDVIVQLLAADHLKKKHPHFFNRSYQAHFHIKIMFFPSRLWCSVLSPVLLQAGRTCGTHDLLFCFLLIPCIHWHSSIIDMNVRAAPRREEKSDTVCCFLGGTALEKPLQQTMQRPGAGPAGAFRGLQGPRWSWAVTALSMTNNRGIHQPALIAAPNRLHLYWALIETTFLLLTCFFKPVVLYCKEDIIKCVLCELIVSVNAWCVMPWGW